MTLSQKDMIDQALRDGDIISSQKNSKSSGMAQMKVAAASLLALAAMGGIGAQLVGYSGDRTETIMPVYETLNSEALNAHDSSITKATSAEAVSQKGPNGWLIGGAVALILGALYKLVGANRMMNIVANAGPAVRRSVEFTREKIAEAPKMAAKAAASALSSPARMLILIGGLAMIGFTGVSVFDLHWSAGIMTGIGMTAMTWVGTSRFMKKLRPQPVKSYNQDTASRTDRADPYNNRY